MHATGAVVLAAETMGRAALPAGAAMRAAIIGCTGQGNYGHELDLVFNDRPDVEVVAVADSDPAGRAKAVARCRARRQYADYHEMLDKEKPHLVCVAPRWTDEHHAMVMAGLRAGAHILVEKPFTQTLAEADELLAVADKAGLKIAVAHQMRLAPSVLHLKKALEAGAFGELLQIRAHGKQDSRAGGEDMIVLGTHLFDLMRFFAGDAVWCTARIRERGREATAQDARKATEGIGLIVGDEIEAEFAFANGVSGSFTSRGKLRSTLGHWGIELIGSKGAVRVLADVFPNVFLLKPGEWTPNGRSDQWTRLEGDPTLEIPAAERGFLAANQRVVDDWLAAIRQGREPVCSGRAAMKSLEMVMAVFEAGLIQQRVPLPLVKRQHPLRG
jgi:predicted dehydrogenase